MGYQEISTAKTLWFSALAEGNAQSHTEENDNSL